jgi:hypothetical protein
MLSLFQPSDTSARSGAVRLRAWRQRFGLGFDITRMKVSLHFGGGGQKQAVGEGAGQEA